MQIEIDRSLYLTADLRAPGPGLAATAALVTRLAAAMIDELGAGILPRHARGRMIPGARAASGAAPLIVTQNEQRERPDQRAQRHHQRHH